MIEDLRKSLSHLPEIKIEELILITERIKATNVVEMIILFGSYARGNYKEKRGKKQGKKSDYDILVVTDFLHQFALTGKLQNAFDDIRVPVQLVVEDIDKMNDDLREGQYFYSDIKREGKILYDSGKFKLAKYKQVSDKRRRELAEIDFKNWFGVADTNFEMYQFAHTRFKNTNHVKFAQKASFELQQVVEMCYTTIEMVFSRYNPQEHDLIVLRARVSKFNEGVNDIFPTKTPQKRNLFEHLNLAYIGGRYYSEEEYPVTEKQLNYWAKEAQKLLDFTERICQAKIEAFKEIENQFLTDLGLKP